MKARTSIALAAAALFAGVSAASAAGMQQSNAGDKYGADGERYAQPVQHASRKPRGRTFTPVP